MQVHFSTTTPEPATTSSAIKQRIYLLQKSLKLLNTIENYKVAREAHQKGNLKWAALDSGASGNYYS